MTDKCKKYAEEVEEDEKYLEKLLAYYAQEKLFKKKISCVYLPYRNENEWSEYPRPWSNSPKDIKQCIVTMINILGRDNKNWSDCIDEERVSERKEKLIEKANKLGFTYEKILAELDNNTLGNLIAVETKRQEMLKLEKIQSMVSKEEE